jgi:hypothetical protein
MSKPYTESDFSEQVVADRTWRIREISDLRAAIERADVVAQRVLLRALITICYAHWEGFVRLAARKYLEHIALRKFPYKELDRQFSRNYFLPRLAGLSVSGASIAERCSLIDDILDISDQRFSRVNPDIVNTRANLNFEVFSDICRVCGVPVEDYVDHQTFMDVILLKRRNAIAHGEETFVAVEDLPEIAENSIGMMRQFGDSLENQVVLRLYRA